MSYYAKYLKYKKKYLEIRGQLAGGIDEADFEFFYKHNKNILNSNTLWYIKEEDNKGLFDKTNDIYYTDVKEKFTDNSNRTRNLSATYTAKYNGFDVKVQPTEILFEDKQYNHLIVRGDIGNY
jgi:hypothetical protein